MDKLVLRGPPIKIRFDTTPYSYVVMGNLKKVLENEVENKRKIKDNTSFDVFKISIGV